MEKNCQINTPFVAVTERNHRENSHNQRNVDLLRHNR